MTREEQFADITQKTKAWSLKAVPLAHTFEGALFHESPGPLLFSPPPDIGFMPLVENIEKEGEEFSSLVLFVGDSYLPDKGEDLLEKMILAMKLSPGEYHRFHFDESLEEVADLAKNKAAPSAATLELFRMIESMRPKVVVSLGATVTNILLGKGEKLSSVHGQFFKQSLDSHTYHLVPVFHPDFLLINPNMKRTAWMDLQKVMAFVGKN